MGRIAVRGLLAAAALALLSLPLQAQSKLWTPSGWVDTATGQDTIFGTISTLVIDSADSAFVFSGGDTCTGLTSCHITFSPVSQSVNLVYASPGSGGSGVPTFRSIVAADIPVTLNPTIVEKLSNGTAAGDGLRIRDSTLAAAGAQQYSPTLVLAGRGWATNSGGSSQTVEWWQQTTATQGAANPTTNFTLTNRVNSGSGTAFTVLDVAGGANGRWLFGSTGVGPQFTWGTTGPQLVPQADGFLCENAAGNATCNFHLGSSSTANNNVSTYGQIARALVTTNDGGSDVCSWTAATDVNLVTVTAPALAAGDMLHATIMGKILYNGTGALKLVAEYGGTTQFGDIFTPGTSATGRAFYVDIWLMAITTSTQSISGRMEVSGTTSVTTCSGTCNGDLGTNGAVQGRSFTATGAIDSTATRTFTIAMQDSLTDTTNICKQVTVGRIEYWPATP